MNDFRYIEDELGNGKIERYYVNDRQNDRDALGKIRVSLLIRSNPLASKNPYISVGTLKFRSNRDLDGSISKFEKNISDDNAFDLLTFEVRKYDI